jgi:23S rRNA pseudouridine1911/1915/1917 synthase
MNPQRQLEKLSEKDILFEDNHIVVLNKKASEIVQGDKTGDTPLQEKLANFIKTRDQKPGNVFVGLPHRIDRPVSGALIFTKTSKALTRLTELFKERDIRKFYWALVKNAPPAKSDHLVHYLRRDRVKNKSHAKDKEGMYTQKAELKYQLLGKSDNYYLLEVELLTGRHHQIRAQLAAIGCPIKGDIKYGFDRTNKDASINLHSRKIEFVHPVKKDFISVIAPVPDDKLWKHFEASFA